MDNTGFRAFVVQPQDGDFPDMNEWFFYDDDDESKQFETASDRAIELLMDGHGQQEVYSIVATRVGSATVVFKAGSDPLV